MKNKKVWIPAVIILALLAAAFYFRSDIVRLVTGQQAAQASAQGPNGNFDPASLTTTAIRPATGAAQVSASGNIALQSERPVVLQVGGIVSEVLVDAGDAVAAGEVMLSLDPADLERAVERARLSLQSAQAALDKLTEEAASADIASAQAALVSAQENLLDVQAGPGAEELAAAEATLKSARAKYQELLDGPGEAELTQLGANMEKARISLQQAQQAYDRIAYSDSVGSSSQAAQLQQATIDYESVKAAYTIATAPATEAELQSAWSAAQTAQRQLDDLRAKPTAAELASAEAQVSSAAAKLADLLAGAGNSDLQTARINIDKAKLDLQDAEENLAQARLQAPIDGSVLAVNVTAGQQVSAGMTAATLADLLALELTVNVAEVDISKIELGQTAEIIIDALPGRSFKGAVTQIAPASSSQQGVVNYPVTVRLTDDDLSGIRAGMTAVATILSGDDAAANWLVPTTAVNDRNGQTVVLVLRDGRPTPVSVTTMGLEGEWTVVQSPDLKAGDEAVGGVSSFINQNSGGFGGPGGFRPPGFGGGGGNR